MMGDETTDEIVVSVTDAVVSVGMPERRATRKNGPGTRSNRKEAPGAHPPASGLASFTETGGAGCVSVDMCVRSRGTS